MRNNPVPHPSIPFVDDKGMITSDWLSYLQTTTSQWQTYFNQERVKLPEMTQSDITTLSGKPANLAGLLFNSDSQNLNAHVGDSFKPVSTLTEVADLGALNAIPASERDGRFAHDMDSDKLYIGIAGAWREIVII